MIKRCLSLVLAVMMALTLLPFGAGAADAVSSGTCGENVTWKLDADGVLTISGKGAMTRISDANSGMLNDDSLFRMKVYSVVIEPGVTAIGSKAFEGYFRVTGVSIPNTVKEIGSNAFSGCKALKELSIPDSVKTIGEYAFYYCENLKRAVLPAGITVIANDLLSYCPSLTDVSIPVHVTEIGERAFSGCSSLKQLTIPDSVKRIGNSAFSESGLTDITLPSGITGISEYSFIGCVELLSVTIPDGVKTIGESAFQYCEKLKSVSLPASVTEIGSWAFVDCGSLTDIAIPAGVAYVGERAFSGCANLKSITVSPKNEYYASAGGCLFNRDKTWLICVPGGKTGVYTVPDSVSEIGSCAFSECRKLTSVTIPDGVSEIGSCAFSDCRKLTSMTVPDSVSVIGNSAFSGCGSLTAISLPDGLTSINSGTFSLCTGLRQIRIPSCAERIGEKAFYGCSSLTDVTIPEGVTSIEQHAFDGCTGLKRAALPSSLQSVGDAVFQDCGQLRDILFAGAQENWRFRLNGKMTDGSDALGLSGLERIHFNVADPETHIREIVTTAPDGSQERTLECDCGFDFSAPTEQPPNMEIPSVLPPDSGTIMETGTRYGMMHLLWTIAGCPKPSSSKNPFADVSETMAPAVLWAVENKISSGTSHTTFSPEMSVTRGQAVTFIWRFAGSPRSPEWQNPFSDVTRDTYYYDAVCWAHESGAIAFPDGQTTFAPNETVDRISFDPATRVFSIASHEQEQPAEPDTIGFGILANDAGEGTITNCNVPAGVAPPETLEIPGEILGATIIALDCHALENLTTLKTLYLPLSLREVFDDAFPKSLRTIYYEGCSETQWNQIDFHGADLSNIEVRYRAHSWDAGTLDDAGLRHYTCTSCGEKMTALEKKADAGVRLMAEPGQAASLKDAKLVAEKNTDTASAAANVVVKTVSGVEKTQAYDIRLETSQGKTVQPQSAVTVVIPVPANWDAAKTEVYYADPATGKTENMNAVPSSDGKSVSFQTTHFSCYILTQMKKNQSAAVRFQDVKAGAYYAAPVAWAVDRGVTNGTSKTTFSPDQTCTRGQVVTFLWRAAGSPEPTLKTNPFKDLKSSDYYYKAVLWAVEQGITNGTDKTHFSPAAPCTRAHVVTFLWRFENKPAAGKTNPFTDVKSGGYYYDAVLWAVSENITNGTDKTHFSPANPCTRAQIVTFLYRDLT